MFSVAPPTAYESWLYRLYPWDDEDDDDFFQKRACLEAELPAAECPMETSHTLSVTNQQPAQQVSAGCHDDRLSLALKISCERNTVEVEVVVDNDSTPNTVCF